MLKKLFIALVLVFSSLSSPAHALEIPKLEQWVTDATGTLSSDEKQTLSQELVEFENQTSNQVVVVILPSLEGLEIRELGRQIFEKNKIGQKNKNNGVLLLVAKNDRKLSIEVGYGLEGVLTDALTSQIIRHEIVSRFKQGDFFGGIHQGVQSIFQATKGEYKGEGKENSSKEISPFFIFFFLMILLQIIRFFPRNRRYIGSSGVRSLFWASTGFWGGGGFGGGGSFGGGGGFSGGGGSFGGGGSSGSW